MVSLVPEWVRSQGSDLLWLLAGLGVIGSAFSAKTWPGRMVRVLWRRNISGPFWDAYDKNLDRGITRTVSPLIDQVKAAARAQHDEQNTILQQISTTQDDQGARLTALEQYVTTPTDKDGH